MEQYYSDSSNSEEPTPEELEKAFNTTLLEFGKFVSAITNELEEDEEEDIREAEAKAGKPPKRLWEDATFKIKFIMNLLTTIFTSKRLIKYYILYVNPLKPWLTEKDERFFIENEYLYPGAPKEDIKFFKLLWTQDVMSKTEKETIWNYFDVLIEITEDWEDITGWKPTPEEDLDMPEYKLPEKK